ncbi:MAG: ATP-binding cassette domain-containing protein [Lentisphaerae bacterium]|nr:ATP-binding cassette domain-containing protein [Lentisphaerota bacterium]
MALLSLRNVSLHYDGPPLLDDVEFHIERGDRICLLGVNGTGKSSLLRVLSGDVQPDTGNLARAPGLRVTYLPQQVPTELTGRVEDVVCPPLGGVVDDTRRVEAVRILDRFRLDPEAPFASLSGGMRRRGLLARALLGEPDLVLLDEPTNHLDLDSIGELEEYLLRYCRTFMFVTHDRAFLRRLASRVVELDRGKLRDWRCDYDTFLRRQSEVLAAEAKQWALFDKKLAQEEVWIRQGVRARRTRNEGRVRALMDLRAERSRRRERVGSVQMAIQEAERTGQIVLKAKGVSFGFEGRPLIRTCSTVITRGDRIGILGPNGCGKTTLLRLLLGAHAPEGGLTPTAGVVTHGTNLQVAYSDQLRAQLQEDKSLAENVAPGREYVQIGENRRHIMGYLQDFLFGPERARLPVKVLSGGERNRLLLARLFAQPSNVLVLDEPTNDLDLDTLDLLEEQLDSYKGTVLLVSHDREFLNNIATSVLAFEKGRSDAPGEWLGAEDGWYVNEYVGGYDDWRRQRVQHAVPAPAAELRPPPRNERGGQKRGLSSKDKRELEGMPLLIEKLEAEQAACHARMADPAFYRQPGEEIARTKQQAETIANQLDTAYHRWGELEALKQQGS